MSAPPTPPNALLSVVITTLPTSGTLTLNGAPVAAGDFVLATDIAAGKLVYTPAPNATADATFTFQVRDDGGTANGGTDLDASANTLTIDITPVNDAPAGTDTTAAFTEDTAKTLAVGDFGVIEVVAELSCVYCGDPSGAWDEHPACVERSLAEAREPAWRPGSPARGRAAGRRAPRRGRRGSA